MADHKTLLTLAGVSKHFGGAQALAGVDVAFERGKIHSLIGENGAGKSTLGKILLGVHKPDEGTITLDGAPIRIKSPAHGNELGLVGIAQELSLMPNRSVADNISLGREVVRGLFVDARKTRDGVLAVMDHFDMRLDPDVLVGALPVAEQQKVEILRALSRDAQLIVFDEPTARLASHQAEQLLRLVKSLAAAGKAIVYVSHFLDEVLKLSDTITILRNGKLVRTSDAASETRETLIVGVTGQEVQNQYPTLALPDLTAAPVLTVRGASLRGAFEQIDLDIRPGEIVGLAGLVGSGRSALAHAIFGAARLDAGSIQFRRVEISQASVADCIGQGMALVPESRRDQGLNLSRSILENVSLPYLKRFSGWLGLDKAGERQEVDARCRDTAVKHDGLDRAVETLSGGNQQKILFARAAMGAPRLLIADEPTRGVDVGAKRGIYALIARMAADGEAILLISSEIEEIMGLCHRVIVMSRGRVAAELTGQALTENAVMNAAFSGG